MHKCSRGSVKSICAVICTWKQLLFSLVWLSFVEHVPPYLYHRHKEIYKHFEHTATLFRLTINAKKTVTLYQPPQGQTSVDPHVEIYGTSLKSVNNFTYLSSSVASDNTINAEINNRIHAASGAFGGLWKL